MVCQSVHNRGLMDMDGLKVNILIFAMITMVANTYGYHLYPLIIYPSQDAAASYSLHETPKTGLVKKSENDDVDLESQISEMQINQVCTKGKSLLESWGTTFLPD